MGFKTCSSRSDSPRESTICQPYKAVTDLEYSRNHVPFPRRLKCTYLISGRSRISQRGRKPLSRGAKILFDLFFGKLQRIEEIFPQRRRTRPLGPLPPHNLLT